jgi:hypothetical protein
VLLIVAPGPEVVEMATATIDHNLYSRQLAVFGEA